LFVDTAAKTWLRISYYLVGQQNISCKRENENYQLGRGFFVHRIIMSTVKRVEFLSEWM